MTEKKGTSHMHDHKHLKMEAGSEAQTSRMGASCRYLCVVDFATPIAWHEAVCIWLIWLSKGQKQCSPNHDGNVTILIKLNASKY